MTPELLEKGVECVASNSLGKNSTIIFLELGTGFGLQSMSGMLRQGHQLRLFQPPVPIHLTALPPDSNRTTDLITSTVSPYAKANSTSTGKLGLAQEQGCTRASSLCPNCPWKALSRKVSTAPLSEPLVGWSSNGNAQPGAGNE